MEENSHTRTHTHTHPHTHTTHIYTHTYIHTHTIFWGAIFRGISQGAFFLESLINMPIQKSTHTEPSWLNEHPIGMMMVEQDKKWRCDYCRVNCTSNVAVKAWSFVSFKPLLRCCPKKPGLNYHEAFYINAKRLTLACLRGTKSAIETITLKRSLIRKHPCSLVVVQYHNARLQVHKLLISLCRTMFFVNFDRGFSNWKKWIGPMIYWAFVSRI